MDNKTYQANELKRFYNQNNGYYDNVKDLSEWIENSDVLTQIEWIENGTYGAGACFALQRTLEYCKSPMVNKRARIGETVLRAFYGKEFRQWKKLSDAAKLKMNKAVDTWLRQKHEFAEELI